MVSKIPLNFGRTKNNSPNNIRVAKQKTTAGYIIADLILFRVSCSFSRNPESRSSTRSRMPPASAERIIFTYSGEKTRGCFWIASVRLIPPATSRLTSPMTSFILGLRVCFWRISRHFTTLKPASIIVANCRLKTTKSRRPTRCMLLNISLKPPAFLACLMLRTW